MTVVGIHQPNYLPWLGFFAKVMECDVLVIHDNIQFEKGGYTNRVRIKTSQGVQWLTQPVLVHGRAYQQIRDVGFAEAGWPRKHLKFIQSSYARAEHFEPYFSQLAGLLCISGSNLSECNERVIRWLCTLLQLRASVVRASQLGLDGNDATQRLISLVKAVGGDTYLSGRGGFEYQNLEEFERAGVRVVRSRSGFPEYPQLWGAFCHGLSIVDLLFNCGPASRGLLEKGT